MSPDHTLSGPVRRDSTGPDPAPPDPTLPIRALSARPLSARPLLATTPDQRLYVTSDADETAFAAIAAGLNVAVVSERGAGATSLLHSLEYHLERATAAPATPDRATEHPTAATATSTTPIPLFVNAAGRDAADILAEVAERAATNPATASPAVVLLDGTDLPTFRDLFGAGRDTRWQEGHQWVVAIPADAATSYLSPPADVFFETTVRLTGAPLARLEEILARRLDRPVTLPAGMDGLTPRQALTLVREHGLQSLDDAARDAAEVAGRVAALGRPESMLFAELQALGAAAASDPRLLDRLGWTAARAGQVFRSLLDEGLVEYSDEHDGRPGRPRRVYRVRGSNGWGAAEGGGQ